MQQLAWTAWEVLNSLLDKAFLRNRYLAMRHGHSLANEQGIIVSHPDNGCHGYGLSEPGKTQVETSMRRNSLLDAQTLIVTSDFKRALESAQIVQKILGALAAPLIETRLRERYFGELELSSDRGYDRVWCEDAVNPDSEHGGMESANQVMRRVTAVICDLEKHYKDATILLVSHGDALQILQTAFARRAASDHRELEHLHTAEIRQLNLSLPDMP